MMALAAFLAGQVAPHAAQAAVRAAQLAKADLVTQMVGEFPELQGIVGSEYARRSREPEEVAAAVLEHYLPRFAGDDLPSTVAGALVSVADKMDSICGCFAVGLAPSGAGDPYALRRQALGAIHILLDQGFEVSLSVLAAAALDAYGETLNVNDEAVVKEVMEFFKGRLTNLYQSKGYPTDLVDAVLAAGFDNLPDLDRRMEAVMAFRSHEDFEALSIGFKRVANITRQPEDRPVDTNAFEMDEERALYDAFAGIQPEVSGMIERKQYTEALSAMATLRETVDNFFDTVFVMTDDARIRANRLALLTAIAGLFREIADFSRLHG